MKDGYAVVKSGVQTYKGSLVGTDTSGQVVLCADLGAAGNAAGVAEDEVLGDGTKTVHFVYGHQELLPCETNVVATCAQKAIFAFTDNGVTAASTVGPCIGVLKQLESSSLAWIEILGPAMADNT
jgi:hypothetical protein